MSNKQNNREDKAYLLGQKLGEILTFPLNLVSGLCQPHLQEKRKLSLDEFLEEHSLQVDKLIIDIEKEEGLSFGTGRFIISDKGDELFTIGFKLYFRKSGDDNIIIKSNESEPLDMQNFFDEETIINLKEAGCIEFKIEPPDNKSN